MKLAAVAGMATLGILGFQASVGAATPTTYQGTTTTTTTTAPSSTTTTTAPSGTTTTLAPATPTVAVSCGVGSTCSVTVCGFSSGVTISITVNGQADGTATVGGSGCATLSISVTDPHISVDGAALIAVPVGTSTVTASGAAPSGATQVDSVQVTIPGSSNNNGLAFTGADIVGMVVGGLALIAVGFLVLMFTRRRRVVGI